MKNLLSVTLAFIFSITTSFAQTETAKPTHDVTVEREIAYATIEKKEYKNVTITLKAAPLSGNVFTDGKNDSRNHIYMLFPMANYKSGKAML